MVLIENSLFIFVPFCSGGPDYVSQNTIPTIYYYEIPRPEIPLNYGFPDHTPNSLGNLKNQYEIGLPTPLLDTPVQYSNQAAVDVIDASALSSANGATRTIPVLRQKRSLFDYSQTTKVNSQSTSTNRPRTRYDDEGKWKIIRQEENKEAQKYDYL